MKNEENEEDKEITETLKIYNNICSKNPNM